MSRFECPEYPATFQAEIAQIYQASADKTGECINELLDCTTCSKPATYDVSTNCIYRVHLELEDARLPECKRQIKEIKSEVHDWLKAQFGDAWIYRNPQEIALKDESNRVLQF